MKNLGRILSFLPIVLLLTACPYESSVPITSADKPIDQNLLGKWVKSDEVTNEYPSEYYQINDLGGTLYEVLKYSFSSEDSTYSSETYISHISILIKDGKAYRFLNMKKSGSYYLHRVDLSVDEFVLYEVTDNIDDRFNTSEELKDFVKANMHLSFFYNKDEVTFKKVE